MTLTAVPPTSPPAATPRPAATRATLIAAGLLTMMAGATVAPAIPAIRDAFEGTAHVDVLTGMVLSTHALAILLVSPLAGYVVDRVGRKPSLLLGMALFGLGGTSGFYLPDLPTILAGRFVLGVGVALLTTSVAALIGDLYSGAVRQKLIGQQAAAATAGGVVILLGGGALASLGWREIFLIYLAGLLLMLPVVAYVPGLRIAEATDVGTTQTDADGLGTWLIAPAVAMFAVMVTFYSVPTHLPSVLGDGFGLGPMSIAMVLSAMSLSMAGVTLNFHRIEPLAPPAVILGGAFASMAVGLIILAVAPSVAIVVLGLAVMAAGVGLSMPTVNSWVIGTAPAAVRGRASGVVTTALFAGQFASPLLTQPVVSGFGRQASFGVVAVAALGFAATYFALAGRRREDRPEAWSTTG